MGCPPDRHPELIGFAEREKSPIWTIAIGQQRQCTRGDTLPSMGNMNLNQVDLDEIRRVSDADVVPRMGLLDHFDPSNLYAVTDHCQSG